ncbi:MAG: CDP-6-deoxy-delta-3,4-glucoseen reductase [Xanthomonadaceae bacterium]|nr:CDP-6-deoxy-delta-3,4-glucoseen reductase [Xanthomonadaceae bacterium]
MSYTVTIQPSGHQISVNEGETIVDAALRQGIVIPYSCRGGTCSSCLGEVISGRLHYPDGIPPGITEAEIAAGKALFCSAMPLSDLEIRVREVRAGTDFVPRKLPVRVVEIADLSHDVRRLLLKPPANLRMPFFAGQYIDILLPGGKRRGFSLANAPHDDECLELHVRLVPGGQFTKYVFTELREGTLLRIEGPFGQFYLREDSERPILLMGGGTGFAPLKGILEHAFQIGVQRPLHLYWGVRARRDLYLHELPTRWAQEHPNFRYTPVLSDPDPRDQWQGRTGLVPDALLADYPDLSGYDVYMSGPPAMIEAARKAFLAHGLDPAHLYYDSFDFAPDSRTKAGA